MKRLIIILFCLFLGCSKSDIELFEEAKLAESKSDVQLQYDRYKEIADGHKDSDYHPVALFKTAYIMSNEFKDYEGAKKYYNTFLELYPNDKLVSAVKFEIQYMGVPVSELPFLKNDSNRVKSE